MRMMKVVHDPNIFGSQLLDDPYLICRLPEPVAVVVQTNGTSQFLSAILNVGDGCNSFLKLSVVRQAVESVCC